MQFTTITAASLLSALALASPLASRQLTIETVSVTDGFARQNNGLQVLGFKATTCTPDEASNSLDCTSPSNPALSTTYSCTGTSEDYSFTIDSVSLTGANITIFHALGPGFGRSGKGEIPLYSRAGGNGPDDYVSQQVGDVDVEITGA